MAGTSAFKCLQPAVIWKVFACLATLNHHSSIAQLKAPRFTSKDCFQLMTFKGIMTAKTDTTKLRPT